MEEHDKFSKNVGLVLSSALHVETTLEFFISNYFIKPQIDKTHFFNDSVLLKMNFEKKIELFKDICKREEFDKKEVKSIIKSIRHVQEIRNKVAHWQSEISYGNQIQLRKRTSSTTQKDIIKLDNVTMKVLDKERLKAIQGINDLYMKYQQEGTIDERPTDWRVI